MVSKCPKINCLPGIPRNFTEKLPDEYRKVIEVHDEAFLTSNSDTIIVDEEWQQTTKNGKANYYRIIEKELVSEHDLINLSNMF